MRSRILSRPDASQSFCADYATKAKELIVKAQNSYNTLKDTMLEVMILHGSIQLQPHEKGSRVRSFDVDPAPIANFLTNLHNSQNKDADLSHFFHSKKCLLLIGFATKVSRLRTAAHDYSAAGQWSELSRVLEEDWASFQLHSTAPSAVASPAISPPASPSRARSVASGGTKAAVTERTSSIKSAPYEKPFAQKVAEELEQYPADFAIGIDNKTTL
jgi:hypothetical protein